MGQSGPSGLPGFAGPPGVTGATGPSGERGLRVRKLVSCPIFFLAINFLFLFTKLVLKMIY